MKHILNLIITLALIGFGVGVTYVVAHSPSDNNAWPVLYLPLVGLYVLWGFYLKAKY